jgi:hypothetical protein
MTRNPSPHGTLSLGERRRSSRFPLVLSIGVQWRATSGELIQADAEAREGNNHGGLLEMKITPPSGSDVVLTNPLSSESARARVTSIHPYSKGTAHEVAVEFHVPSVLFWRIGFRLKKAAAELRELDEAIKSGNIDPRVLREFRDAVDYVCKTAWAVQEWQERQFQKRDTATVLPLLTAERVRRTTQLSDAILSDLNTHEATAETPGINELYRSVERLREHLGEFFKSSQPH